MASVIVHTNGAKQLDHLLNFLQYQDCRLKIAKKKNAGLNDGPVLIDGETKLSGLVTVALSLSQYSTHPLLGDDELEYTEINQWLSYCSYQINNDRKSKIKELDAFLSDKCFLVGNRLSTADVLLFTYLYKDLTKFTHAEIESHVNLLRWCDQMQHIPGILNVNAKKMLPIQRTLLY